MTTKKQYEVDVAIIGAGTAGLSAASEVRKQTESYLVIDGGTLGTTCARVGCMPSKVLLQVANDFHRRKKLSELGIAGGEQLTVNLEEVMQHVRKLRDYFVSGVLKSVDRLGDSFLKGFARFVEPTLLDVDGHTVRAKKVVIAAGSTPIVPAPWQSFADKILTSDSVFEQASFKKRLAVIGLGVIGIELGQALNRLGIETTGFGKHPFIANLTDSVVNDYAVKLLREEMPIHLGETADVEKRDQALHVQAGNHDTMVDTVLASLGRRANLQRLELDKLGIELNAAGMPNFNPKTMQVEDLPLFIAGDINGDRPILHEAADEGRIAGFNAVHDEKHSFKRRVPLGITFSDPNIAVVGQNFASLKDQPIAIGEVSFDDQGRSRVMAKNRGVLRVYASRKDGTLLGSEMIAPHGEHLAHLLAWAIQKQTTVFEALTMPFYHPVVEEGLRTALRQIAHELAEGHPQFELAVCDAAPAQILE